MNVLGLLLHSNMTDKTLPCALYHTVCLIVFIFILKGSQSFACCFQMCFAECIGVG